MAQQPEDASLRGGLSIFLGITHQYERQVEEGVEAFKVVGLLRLGRVEEAGQLAQKLAAEGDVPTLFKFLNDSDNSEALVQYTDAHWPDLEHFETEFPAQGFYGYQAMIDIAFAVNQAGNQLQFNDAMLRIRRAQDRQLAAGVNNFNFDAAEASYYAMAGDHEKAIDFFEKAVARGFITTSRASEEWPYLKPLEGDPRFEAAQARMIEHLNHERAALGLEPVKA